MECSKSDGHCEFTPEMFYLMQRGSHGKRDPMNPSVTALLSNCLRQVVIKERIDYRVSPRRSWYLLRGNMIHYLFEDTLPKDGWKELYHSRDLKLSDGRTVSVGGKVDKLVKDKLLIRDYKTTRRLPTRDRSDYGSHGLQLNIYRWIWWPIFHAEKLRLQYIDMGGTKQIKVDLMDIAEVETMIQTKADAYVAALESPKIPKGEFDPKNWACRYCDVQSDCKKINEEVSSVKEGQRSKDRSNAGEARTKETGGQSRNRTGGRVRGNRED
jgi:hypothetical protein